MHSNISNDQVIFCTAGYDNTIRFWEAHTGHCYRVLQHNDSQVNCMAIYPEKTLLATGGYQQILIYDTMSNNTQHLINIDGTVKNTLAIGFHERGNFMYTAGEDKTVKLWDMRSRSISCNSMYTNAHPISCASLHPNQVDFMIGDEGGNLLRWDIRSNQAEQLIQKPSSPIRSLSINQEGNMISAINNEGKLYLWLLANCFGPNSSTVLGRCISNEDSPHAQYRYGLKCLFSPDSTLIATSSADGSIKIWLTNDLSLMGEMKLNKNGSLWIWDLAFTCDSEYLFSVSSDKLARLWSVKTCGIKREYTGHQKPVVCLAFSDTKI